MGRASQRVQAEARMATERWPDPPAHRTRHMAARLVKIYGKGGAK